jgi:hypothetical protein
MHHLINTLRLPWLNLAAFKNRHIRNMANDAIKGPAVTATKEWANHPAVRSFVSAYSQLMLRPNYYGGQVWLALVVGATLLLLSCLIFVGLVPLEVFGLSLLVAKLIALGVFGLGGYALYVAFSKDWGPQIITARTYIDSRERLADSLDHQVQPASLMMTLLLMSFVVADGVLAGTAIIGFFKTYFTPGMAMAMAMLWGALVGIVLWELSDSAADESCVNNGRSMARQMDASNNPIDKDRIIRFLGLVGTRIGIDLADRKNYVKRMVFFMVVLVLAAMSVSLRVSDPKAAPSNEPTAELAAATRYIHRLAADDEISIPPPTDAPKGEPGQNSAKLDGTKTNNGILSAIILACVFIASGIALYWSKAKACFLNQTQSPADHAVVSRFPSEQAAQVFNRNHAQAVVAALDQKLQQFAREIGRAKKSLRPQEQLLWAPCELRAAELLGAEWQDNMKLMGG